MPTLCRAVDDGGFGKNLNRVSKNEHATVLATLAERQDMLRSLPLVSPIKEL